ncbi:MAG TPA: Na-translocating system protein MpsC family protein [Solirubrobacteraceae bacterium]|nr:Na-translocating system protein MpsC family protein [Solirubrobacteraceae bacterium]
MDQGDQKALGEIRATISKEIVRLQAEYYGKGPTKAKTYIVDDLVVVVLEESFTRAEKTLAHRGEREAIQHIRRRFQQAMADSFTSIVEQATGRRVRAFLSETNIEQDVSVETFLLADERTDMTRFEDA